MDIQSQLLEWINEDFLRCREEHKPGAVAIHLLMVKMALLNRSNDTTASIELSLQIFDRANLYRSLREMHGKGWLIFVDDKGEEVSVEEKELRGAASGEKTNAKFVALTPDGEEQAKGLTK